MTVLLDDHFLRDWLTVRDDDLVEAVAGDPVATTNLWYARLCKSAVRASDGALLGGWSEAERRVLVSSLVSLPRSIEVVPMRDLAWSMGELVAAHNGLSMLGAEAVAAGAALDARVIVSARDDGPGIRAGCDAIGIPYQALHR